MYPLVRIGVRPLLGALAALRVSTVPAAGGGAGTATGGWQAPATVLMTALIFTAFAAWAVSLNREMRRRRQAEESARAAAERLAESRKQLEGAHLRLRELTESVAGLVFQLRIMREGPMQLEFVSGRLLSTLGLDSVRLLEDPAAMMEAVAPEDRQALIDGLRNGPGAGQIRLWEHEFRVVDRAGRRRWVRVESLPRRATRGEVVASGYISDIDDRHQMQEALERSRQELQRVLARTSNQLQGILDHSPAAIWAQDAAGVYQFANESFRRMFHIGRDSLVGKRADDIFPHPLVESFHMHDEQVLNSGRAASFVEPIFHEGVARHLLSFRFPMFDDAGRVLGLGGMSLEITEQLRLQEQLQDLNRSLELRERELRQLNASLESRVEARTRELSDALRDLAQAQALGEAAGRAKTEFLANMSHEVRTPMNAIVGLTQLALADESGARRRDLLGKIASAAQSLLGVVNDILDFSKIEAGKMRVEVTDFDLDEVLERLEAVVAQQAQDKGLQFRIERPAWVARLRGDPLRLGQVLVNLAGNAVKFTRGGHVTVSLRLEPLRAGEWTLHAEVRDTGIGLSVEDSDRLFRPFEQADTSTTRHHGGTGLGLAISKQLVEIMGGRIGVDSKPGAGSRFWFHIPIAASVELESQAPEPVAYNGKPKAGFREPGHWPAANVVEDVVRDGMLARLHAQIDQDDTGAVDTLEEIFLRLGHPRDLSGLDELRRALGDFDFEAAKLAVRAWSVAIEETAGR